MRKTPTTTKHAELIKLSMIFAKKKDEIQQRFDNGSLSSYKQLADEYNVAETAIKTLCMEFGIKSSWGTKTKKRDKCSLSAIVMVLHRLCLEIGVDYAEIKPFIHEQTQEPTK
jgi:hypothetical protein